MRQTMSILLIFIRHTQPYIRQEVEYVCNAFLELVRGNVVDMNVRNLPKTMDPFPKDFFWNTNSSTFIN